MRSKQVIVVRRDIKLSIGKLIAQCVHASMRVNAVVDYSSIEQPICIVCQVKNENELLKLAEKAKQHGVKFAIQMDAGFNEVEAGTITALSIGPDEPEKVDKVTKRLQLYK